MRRSFKFLLRPTTKQQAALTAMLGDHCTLYNAALEERREGWRRSGATVRYGEQSAQLKEIRVADPDHQGRWSFSSQQATLRRLDRAMAAFFRRVKAGQKPGYPRFRGQSWFNTVEFPKDGDGCRWDSTPHDPVTRVRLQGVGHVRVHRHRPVEGQVKTISVKREGRRWFVILACDDVPVAPLPQIDSQIGIDLGIASFLTTSDGACVPNPRCGRRAATRLADAQQALSRCERRSSRRRKAVAKVAALHARVRRQRLDHAHKTALELVRAHDVIVHEDLRVANLVRRAAPVPDGDGGHLPNRAAAKTGLNRSISDAGWGRFLTILAAKAESAGRTVIAVDPRNTSRKCLDCGHTCPENRVTQADFCCVRCGFTAHADVVGAINILRAGLVLREAMSVKREAPARGGGVTWDIVAV